MFYSNVYILRWVVNGEGMIYNYYTCDKPHSVSVSSASSIEHVFGVHSDCLKLVIFYTFFQQHMCLDQYHGVKMFCKHV